MLIGVILNAIVNAIGKQNQAEAARSSATVSAIVTVALGVVLHANVEVVGKQKQAEAGRSRQKQATPRRRIVIASANVTVTMGVPVNPIANVIVNVNGKHI